MRNYFDIPIEIRNKIKERIEEVGNPYNETLIAEWYKKEESIPGNTDGGFHYGQSNEGFNFWAKVINDEKHHIFFERYPKKIFKAGQKVRVLKNEFNDCKECIDLILVVENAEDAKKLNDGRASVLSYNGQINYFHVNFEPDWLEIVKDDIDTKCFEKGKAYLNEKEGTIYEEISTRNRVILKKNDGSTCPYFWNSDKSDWFCRDWYKLKRVEQSITKSDEQFSNKARPEEIVGTQYVLCEEYADMEVGTIVTLEENDGSSMPYFKLPNGRTVLIFWKRLKAYKEVNNLNLNTTKDGSKESHTIELVLSRISATITFRPAPRGVELSSTRSKIQLGS